MVGRVIPLRLIPVAEYGFAEAQPRSSTPTNGRQARLDKMEPWDLCIGSTGRAQGARALPKTALPTLT